MHRSSRTIVLAATAFLLLVGALAVSGPVSAHEHVEVGEYEFTVGWREEPAVVGVLNGLDLGIEEHRSDGSHRPVEGVQANLTAVLRFGSSSVVKDLEPQFGQPGWYTFDVIPTREGSYSVQLTGTLNTTAIDVTVDLDDVRAASSVQFPQTEPGPSELQGQIVQLNGQLASLQTLLTLVTAVSIVAIAVGLAGLGLFVRATRRTRNAP